MFTNISKFFYRGGIALFNNPLTAAIVEKLTRSRCSRFLIKPFIRKYDIDLSEIEKPFTEYPSLASFFTRKVRMDLRKIDWRPEVFVSPVDGTVSLFSDISPDASFIVKGRPYRLQELLGDVEKTEYYAGGTIAIIYLSPANYHRIHIPVDSEEIFSYTLGRRAFPVNESGLRYGKRPLTLNHRLVSIFRTKEFEYALIAVGATNVNSIIKTESKEKHCQKLDEFGMFSFGSTVILLFPKDSVNFSPHTEPYSIRAGEYLCEYKSFDEIIY